MPRPSNTVPSILHHKKSGQAYCYVRHADGSRQQVYLGPWGSPESFIEFARVLGGHVPTPKTTGPATVAPTAPLTVAELVERFLTHAEIHYRHPDGTSTGESTNYRLSVRPLLHLFGSLSVVDFGPRYLKKVRELMLEGYDHPACGSQPALSRKVINARIGRIVRVFKWGVGEELVPETSYRALTTVQGLQAGRSGARETEPVKPVSWEDVEKTLAKLHPVARAMVLIEWYTGMRPGEVCAMRADEIDRSGEVWEYRPRQHKTAYRNRTRIVPIGPQGQAILAPYIDRDGFLFSPAEATRMVREAQKENRRTKSYPCEDRRRARRKKIKPKRQPGERYTTGQYHRVIARACVAAGVPHWHPNQIRHAFATMINKFFDIEAARVILGHGDAATTRIYAERDLDRGREVAKKIG